ncbi:MAG: hypothetical protein ABR498_08520 [Candidatus Dormibacteria bacterium]
MRLRRGKQRSLASYASEYEARVNEVAQREGTEACTEMGCTATTGVACEYVDRRARTCPTAWCPHHRVLVEDHVYCRRHAGVVSALPDADSSLVVAFPDLENRAPSLVGWMARQIDGDVWRLLLSEIDARSGGQLVSDPVMLVLAGLERERAWERAWKLVTHTGVSRRVSILVTEANDAEVIVKVAGKVVAMLTPPWITHRRQHEQVGEEEDARERAEFNQRLVGAIEEAIANERQYSGENP